MSESDPNGPGTKPGHEEEIANILKRIKDLERVRDAEDDMGYKQRQLRFNKWLVVLTGCLVLTSLVANYISKTASDAAKKSADAAALGASVAQSSLKLSQESAKQTLAEMQAQSKAAQTAAEAAKSQATTSKKAAGSAERALQITEAANMAVHQVVCSTAPQPLSTKSEVFIVFKNTGRTRADNVQVGVFLGVPSADVRIKSKGRVSIGSVAAGEPRNSGSLIVSDAITDEMLAQINDGTLQMRLWGWSTYDDVFSRSHRMEFDTIYKPNTACVFEVTTESNR